MMDPDSGTSAADGVTARVAAYVSTFETESVSADGRRAAARAFANWYACALGGSRDDSVAGLLAVLTESTESPSATALGGNRRLGVADAAFVNAFAANALDFDDMHVPTLIHPTGPVVGAALAVAESRLATGRDLLDAVIVGIEVELAVGACLFPDHYDQGWHTTATAGVLGAAAAACRLMGFGRETTAAAFGLAATQAGGLRAMLPNQGKNLNVGRAAWGGVLAARLAGQGLTSAAAVFEERFGYFDVFAPQPGWEDTLSSLGRHHRVAEITLKPYPCGVVVHPVIDACLAIFDDPGFDAQSVEAVTFHVHPRTAVLAGKQDPASEITSRFSLHHAAALALTRGAADFDAFESTDVADPALAALRRRMTVHASPDLSATHARVVVELASGRRLERDVTEPVGGPSRPLDDEQLARKFVQLCSLATDAATAERLWAQCLAVDGLPGVSTLCNVEEATPTGG